MLDFLLKNEGGNSQKTFKDLCNLNDCDTVRYMIPDMVSVPDAYSQICETLLNRVAEQPVLVSLFKVSNLESFSGRPDEESSTSSDDTTVWY